MAPKVKDDISHSKGNPAPSAPAPTLRVELADSTNRLSDADCRWLLDTMGRAFGEASKREASRTKGSARPGEVRVRIVGDAEMATMHEEYAGVPGTTDVLTFDMSVDEDGSGVPPLDVDLVACLDEAERQAKARGTTAVQELLLYSLHGVLHCLGHDDHEDTAYRDMHAAEDQILTAIGVGAIFHRAERPASGKSAGHDGGHEGGGDA